MKPFRFLHAADLHLDSPFRGMTALPDAVRDRVRESTFLAFYRMIDAAVEERVDFVVISGDVYDLADRSLRAQIRFQKGMEKLAERGIPVFVVHGNHDPEDGRRAELAWPETVRIFGSREVEAAPVCVGGKTVANVYGISYPTSAVTDNLADRFKVKEGSPYDIAVLHCNVDGEASHDNYAPCSRAQLVQSGFHYWALGHIHARRVLHEHPHIVYPGNLQGRSVRETGAKGCYIVQVSDTGRTELKFRAVDALRWFCEPVSIAGIGTEQELRERIDERLEQVKAAADGRPSLVRLVFEGRGSLHTALQRGTHLQELIAEIRDEQAEWAKQDEAAAFVWIESAHVQTGAPIDMRLLLEQDSFLGDLLRISRQLMNDEEELQALCESALSGLLTHPKAGKIAAALAADERREWLKAAEQLAADLLTEDEGGER